MEKRVTLKEGHNCLVISMAGDQSYVKIYDANGDLLREEYVSGSLEVHHLAEPGKYKVDSDGTIKSIRSSTFEMRSDAAVLGLQADDHDEDHPADG